MQQKSHDLREILQIISKNIDLIFLSTIASETLHEIFMKNLSFYTEVVQDQKLLKHLNFLYFDEAKK